MMNWKEAGEGFRAPRRISNCFKDRDEELSFFRDLQKREKDQVASLLQPVSEEFEANGNFGLYGMDSGGRKGSGLEFLGESGKNDYNWLKTPPATPLFPSLEMETNGQELVVQRELPIIQPRSRFAGNPEGTKPGLNRSTSPIPKPKLPQRHKTPNGRPSISSLIDKKNMKSTPTMNQTTSTVPDKTKRVITPAVEPTVHKESHLNFAASNLSKSMGTEPNSSAYKPKSRGVSPFVRPKIPGFSDETPPNLITTNRPASATRGRPTNQNLSTPQNQDTNLKIRRQSCSPSVTRGRKLEADGSTADQTNAAARARQAGNTAQVLGSRMVDRFMNARISNADERRAKIKLNGSMNENPTVPNGEARQAKVKLNGSMNENSGSGRLMSRSSLDMALKHMEFERDGSSSRRHGMVPGRKH